MTNLLAEIAELRLLTGDQLKNEQLQLALERASNEMVAAIGFPIVETVCTHTVYGEGGKIIRLPARPITEVVVTTKKGESLTGITVDERLGLLTKTEGWPNGQPFTVSYKTGWPLNQIPGDIKSAVLEQAQILLSSNGAYQQETIGPKSVTYSQAALGGRTQNWVNVVDRYRLAGDWS